MLRPDHAGKYKDLAVLLTRYGLKDFKVAKGDPTEMILIEKEDEELDPDISRRAESFVESLKAMGPTYIKFGQILSTRADIVPQEYLEALEQLQNEVEPFPYSEVEQIVEEELKIRISRAFSSFETEPLAAASLGQVHRAVLRDGREVVVKVQRPNVQELVLEDLKVFDEIAAFLESHSGFARKMNLIRAVEQGRKTILNELDYRQEAGNFERLRRNLAEFPQIYVPQVIHDYTTRRMITTELIKGKKVSKISPLALTEHDYTPLAAVLVHAYLKQICVDGFWHADPHPGNIFIVGDSLVLLDFGMVARISSDLQDHIIKLLLAVTENRGKDAADACIAIGQRQEGFDRKEFIERLTDIVTTYHDVDLERANTGQLIFAVISIANEHELQLPAELAMLAKTLLHLDGITKKLNPEFNARETIRSYSERLFAQKVSQKFHPRNFYAPLLDLNELALELPKRSRILLDQFANGQTAVNVKLPQAEDLLKGMNKIANRITMGLVIAALLVASSLMMRVDTRFVLFGYPGIAMIGYMIAAVSGIYLIISTIWHDRKDSEHARFKIDA
jgi:ubiquinone biosynthesis protein